MARLLLVIAAILGFAEWNNRSVVYNTSKGLVEEQLQKAGVFSLLTGYKVKFVNLPTITALNSTNQVLVYLEGPANDAKEIPVKVVGHCIFECVAYVKGEDFL